MKKAVYAFVAVMLAIFVASAVYIAYKIDENKIVTLDIVQVNDIVQTVRENWEHPTAMAESKYGLEYTVLDVDNTIVAQTSQSLCGDLNSAIAHHDTIVDIYDGKDYLGKLVIYNDYDYRLYQHKKNLYITCFTLVCVLIVMSIVFTLYIYKIIFKPFNKLQGFAKNVAAGNLDLPLEMDKRNVFGAFTESFDLMRDELKSAREAEQKANKSKKELVAQLSHDIKTPVASIKAVSELLVAKATINRISQKDIVHLETIGKKSDQINTLITNMFNATLEELQELKVDVGEQSSAHIYNIICSADSFNKVEKVDIPQCLIHADINRLTQVIDNIISNSYKYADTEIMLNSCFEDEYLKLEFTDFGNGVDDEEIPLLCNKFYRATNSDGKSGAGLGLYISRYLMTKMQGDIVCENIKNGFRVTLFIKLV